MKNKKEHEPGDEIAISGEKELKVVNDINAHIKIFTEAFVTASRLLENQKALLFGFINELHPELKEYNYAFDHEKNLVTVYYKKSAKT